MRTIVTRWVDQPPNEDECETAETDDGTADERESYGNGLRR